ncbi:MAG: BatA domain-containing protein [Gemmatimonadaceae bacterium]
MTFLAPAFLFASVAVAAGIVALHFIVTRQPRSSILPTARFVPDTPATTIAPARRPSDLLVMTLRVLTVLAAGTGMAKPVLRPARQPNARVVLVDVSRSVRDSTAIRDSARAVYRKGDGVVVFDSGARVVAGSVSDSVAHLSPTSRRGNLSGAIIAALRAGSGLRDRADSLELVIISPFAKEEMDAATDSIRRLWRGRARLVHAGASNSTAREIADGKITLSAEPDDPLGITAALGPRAEVRAFIDRAPLRGASSRDTVPGSTVAEGVLIDWPRTARPRGAVSRSAVDTIGGIKAGDARVIAPFERRWIFPVDSLRGADVIARWSDGEPAAIERANEPGCSRSVAIPVASAGDLAIRHDFVKLFAAISRPCAQVTAVIPADPAAVARLVGNGGRASRETFQPPTDTRSTLASWLLALAIATAIAEIFARRGAREPNAAVIKSSPRAAQAA